MLSTKGYAALTAGAALRPFSFDRHDVGAADVLIAISHCGICHTDIHLARNEWGISTFPMVPGHEIVGTISQIGTSVKNFHVGERVGVGCFVDSCRTCQACRQGEEQYCETGMLMTYGGRDKCGGIIQGGYSSQIVVDEHYLLKIPRALSSAGAARCSVLVSPPTRRSITGASGRIIGSERVRGRIPVFRQAMYGFGE